ncbi:hypothetical protein HDF16_005849 [Granulicella aggregans]|uniref:histidine kinase n=1 Tax=Granulicella aggregans TaxID=474949 RepID=A0A7W8E6E3_9BACT|nr:PAS domain-containing sensor histidine kinase [Granulicella aggregans]MBB5061113.1 hypothetical protein [Granulicella aggregans]
MAELTDRRSKRLGSAQADRALAFGNGVDGGYLRELLDSIPALVASLNPKWEVEFVNQPLLDYLGKPFHVLKDWQRSDVVHPDDLSIAVHNIDLASRTGESFDMEVRCRRYDNTFHWFQIRAVSLHDHVGNLTRWSMHMVDIEERKRSEEALESTGRDLRLAINTMPVLAWSTKPDGEADFFNEHFLTYTGLSPEGAAGWGWTAALHPDDRAPLATYWQTLLAEGGTGEFEARMRRSDGEYRYFLFRADPLRNNDGKIVKWYGTNTDINDRKNAEEQLRRSEAFLTEAQRLARIGRFTWRVATAEIWWSNEMYAMFEFEFGRTITFDLIASRLHPDDLRYVADMNQRANAAMSDLEYEHRLVMPNGEVKYMHLIAHSRRDSDGTLEYIGAVQDVTQRRRAEEALAKARQELANVTKATSLGVLTASIAHEVNQPLAGIITNASTCLRMLDGNPPNVDGARETARRTIRDGNRAADVIARLRSLFGQRKIIAEPLDLSEVAREVIFMSVGELQGKFVRLDEELAADLPLVQADRIQIQQVILNLLRNAADAMDRVTDRVKVIQITTAFDGGHVSLAVRDAGVGLDPIFGETIFEAFNTTKPNGMGIGLSVSRSIVTAHQGRIWAEQNDGPGATFTLALPIPLRTEAY